MKKTNILDVFHALEYASAALNALVTCDITRKAGLAEIKAQLLNGKVDRVIADLRAYRERHKDVAKCIDYFGANKDRMYYDAYRACGTQIGSGQIESCCKQIVSTRLKRSGCWWLIARRERATGPENLLEQPAVGGVRTMEGTANGSSLTQKFDVHPTVTLGRIPISRTISQV